MRCLWYDGDAEEAARFYASTFPDCSVGAVRRAPGTSVGEEGDVLMVELPYWGSLDIAAIEAARRG